jgi:hypothetical protein
VDKYQTVLFQTNRYSVPHTAAFAPVTVKAYVDRVAIVHKGQVVAEHRRGYGTNESFLDPLHFVAVLSRKPAWLDHVPAMRDWQLPESFTLLRKQFRSRLGPRTGDRHYIRVLQLLARHPAGRIDRAIGLSLHRSTLTAETIAQMADRLDRGDTQPHDIEKQDEIVRRVQVPMPDLRRFDQLLNPSFLKGDRDDERSEQPVVEAQPQDLEIADDAGRVRQALA